MRRMIARRVAGRRRQAWPEIEIPKNTENTENKSIATEEKK